VLQVMTGFTLYPDKALLEISAKIYNANPTPRHFLWWANPAVKGGDDHQSVFPPDVTAVFDHGKRDVSSFDPHQMIENEEFPGWGGVRYYETALKVTRADGNRDLVLHYASHHIDGDRLDITLKDIRDDIRAVLHYRVYAAAGIIARWSTIENHTQQAITLESAQSATWYAPPGDGYRLSYLSGRWAAETQLNQEPIHEGMKVLESRLGHTGHNLNPWFAIDKDADEEHGGVYFGALAWSGNWRITVEQTPYRQVRVTGGFNTFDFSYPLPPGASLVTLTFYAGFASHGFGQASRLLHNLER